MFNSFAKTTAMAALAGLMIGLPPAAWGGDPEATPIESDAASQMSASSDDLQSYLSIGAKVIDQDGLSLGWITSVIADDTGHVTAITVPDMDETISVSDLSVEDGVVVFTRTYQSEDDKSEPVENDNPDIN